MFTCCWTGQSNPGMSNHNHHWHWEDITVHWHSALSQYITVTCKVEPVPISLTSHTTVFTMLSTRRHIGQKEPVRTWWWFYILCIQWRPATTHPLTSLSPFISFYAIGIYYIKPREHGDCRLCSEMNGLGWRVQRQALWRWVPGGDYAPVWRVLFDACKFDANQLGASHYDAMLVWRVFQFDALQFGAFCQFAALFIFHVFLTSSHIRHCTRRWIM